MSREKNTEIAKALLEGMGTSRDPSEIAALFAEDLVFEIQGDAGVLPWIGCRSGRNAMADFIRDQRAMTEPLAFDVEDVLASEERAVIVGRLQARIKATGDALLPTMLQGLAIGEPPDFIALDHVASGRLQVILPHWRVAEGGVYFVTPTACARAAKIDALSDLLIERLSHAKRHQSTDLAI